LKFSLEKTKRKRELEVEEMLCLKSERVLTLGEIKRERGATIGGDGELE
jgi:hypothetical protein